MSLKFTNYENLQWLVEDMETKYPHKGEIAMNDLGEALQGTINGKANSADTLAGYGIGDAYTKTQTDNKIAGAISSTYKPGGSKTFAQLDGLNIAANEGRVYNVSDKFTTDERFVEGAGKKIPAGTNVAVIDVDETGESPEFKFDTQAGQTDLSDYSTTTEMNTAISTAVQDKIELTDISTPTATGTGNVITAVEYDNSTGEIKTAKGITALTASDFEGFTRAEIDALWTSEESGS